MSNPEKPPLSLDDSVTDRVDKWKVGPEHLPDLSVPYDELEPTGAKKRPTSSLEPDPHHIIPVPQERGPLPSLALDDGEQYTETERPELPSLGSLLNDDTAASSVDNPTSPPDIASLINESVPERSTTTGFENETPTAGREVADHMWNLTQFDEEVRARELHELAGNGLRASSEDILTDIKIVSLHGSLTPEHRQQVKLDYLDGLGISEQAKAALREGISNAVVNYQEMDIGAYLSSPDRLVHVPKEKQAQVSVLLRSFALGDAAIRHPDIAGQEIQRLIRDIDNLHEA